MRASHDIVMIDARVQTYSCETPMKKLSSSL